MTAPVTCPVCKGEGCLALPACSTSGGFAHLSSKLCPNCGGTGALTTEVKIHSSQFELYGACLLSGQVRQEDSARLLDANPEFAAWYKERAAGRR